MGGSLVCKMDRLGGVCLPDHNDSEGHTFRAVHEHGYGVVIVVVWQHGSVVQHRRQQVDRGDRDQEEECCLDQRAFADGFAVQNGGS